MERLKTREEVPLSDAQLTARCRKFLSLSPEFHTRRAPQWWNVTNPHPVYPRQSKGTPFRSPVPFESGDNVLPGMEAFAR